MTLPSTKDLMKMNVVDFAWQVIDMQRTIIEQEREILRLLKVEKNYDELLDSSLKHSQAMAGNILKMCITPGVVEALQAGASKETAP